MEIDRGKGEGRRWPYLHCLKSKPCDHMPTYRLPVLIWKDHSGHFTAALVEFNQAGIGATAAAALQQLKEYLAWLYDAHPWRAEPDFLDAKLVNYVVTVRPEYRVDERIYPCDETLSLRVSCVHGRQDSGILICALPIFGIRFYYYDSQNLRSLVVAYVQEGLKGMTPQQLSRYLPPNETALDEIVINISRADQKRQYVPELKHLREVADPLGDPGVRKQFSRAWERESEVSDLVRRLTSEKANVVLIGDSGSGKSAVLVDAVRLIERRAKPGDEDNEGGSSNQHRFWLTSGARLIAGMQYLGQWEERCEQVIDELSDISGALCVENLLDLVRSGGQGPRDSIASFLIPYLQRAEVRVIAEATASELDACRRLLPGFADLFQVIKLSPMSREKALAVLDRIVTNARLNLGVEAAPAVVELVYRLFSRFFPYHAFPGKTVGFLNGLIERASMERIGEVTAERVVRAFTRLTGFPELFLSDSLLLEESEVVESFASQVIGQPAACDAAARLVMTFKAGLNDPARPIGVLLFCGPTGVGKTELAKAISRFFFGHGERSDRMIRLDMSEYAGYAAAERFIGDPRGQPSDLIKRVRQQPFVVLLLDEIEKAAPEIFDLLLGVFDEGRLTDQYGRTTTFRSAVIIMTSNLGADKVESVGFDKQASPSCSKEAMSFFRPEFFNRIDAIVPFDALDREKIIAITRKELTEIAGREGLSRSGVRLSWSERLVSHLARTGFDARYGARPLQRTLETAVVTPLARHLIENPNLRDVEIGIDLDDEGQILLASPLS